MDISELVFGAFLVAVLFGLGGFSTWRQLWTLRSLRRDNPYSAEESQYLRRRAWRRMVCSALMAVLAGLMIALYGLKRWHRGSTPEGGDAPPGPDQVEFARLFSLGFLALGITFLAILALAFLDVLATRRFTVRQLRQMKDEHEAMLQEQAARLRGQRNGPS